MAPWMVLIWMLFFASRGQQNCAPPDPEYYYVQPSDVQPYFTMAETYTFGDRMFQTNQGPSFPAHQYIIQGRRRLQSTAFSMQRIIHKPAKDWRDALRRRVRM